MSQDPAVKNIGTDPRTIQMLVDPQLQNTYTYGRNNPIILTDPNGEFVFLAPAIIYAPQLLTAGIALTSSAFLTSMLADDIATLSDPNSSLGAKSVIVGASLLGPAGDSGKLFNVSASRLKKFISTHMPGGSNTAGKSIFNESENFGDLLRDAEGVKPTTQPNGRLERIVETDRPIGLDQNGNQVNNYTVITESSNGAEDVVTAFPGTPNKK